ncbi:MAG: YihA family ribosome biogenesis GTP-binding protein [Cryomorphaceae bacterium]|nr:MAG: YihA family ribosome biogenesis GTP-binding protein [Cryomorphaceae bacterium]
MEIKKAIFEKSSPNIENCPKGNLFEIAFIGRSNVGKSSILNMLLNKKSIAKVSKTPGKTKLINYFLINDSIYFVDLPGYGYAKLSKQNKFVISKITKSYFTDREQLKQIFLLIDVRHEIQKSDYSFMVFLKSLNKDFIIIFTKTDKIKDFLIEDLCKNYLQSIKNLYSKNIYFKSSSKSKNGKEEILNYIEKTIN